MLESLRKSGICLYICTGILFIFPFFRSQDDYCEMTCTLSIQAELLMKPLQYKYVIFSPRMKEKNDCYEFLYSFADGENKDPNRYLHIGDLYHHGGKCDKFKLPIIIFTCCFN